MTRCATPQRSSRAATLASTSTGLGASLAALDGDGAWMMFIYLDQSDWSDLHAGKARGAEAQLREFGARGVALYVVSCEHMCETNQLKWGRDSRLAFVRNFPGAVLTEEEATDHLLVAEAGDFVRYIQTGHVTPIQVGVRRAADLSDEAFARLASPLPWPIRIDRRLTVYRDCLSRRARRGETKVTRDAMSAAVGAILKGDVDDFTRAIGNLGPPLGAVRRFVIEALAPHVARALEWWRKRGFVGPSQNRKASIDPHIVSKLPGVARRDEKLVKAIAQLWASEKRARVAPSLAAHASVYDKIENDLARSISAGDHMDARHAVYAPLADVFTCDRRNESPIRQALAGAAVATRIVRCGRLDEVARLIAVSAADSGVAGG